MTRSVLSCERLAIAVPRKFVAAAAGSRSDLNPATGHERVQPRLWLSALSRATKSFGT